MAGRDIVLETTAASKKYCRSLRRSMWYGFADLTRDVLGVRGHSDRLRPHEFWAVDEVSVQVERGECLGLVGANGAGKSTLLKMLHGMVRPDQGTIRIRGRTAPLIEVGAGFHPQLTGRENIYVNAAILGLSKAETDQVFDAIVDFADLGDYIDAPVKFYSSGMYVRLGFSVAIHVNPDVLLVDEVLSVGDVRFQSKCFNRVAEMRNAGMTMIFVSHNMHHLSSFCDHVLYLRKGQSRVLGEPGDALAVYTSDMMEERKRELGVDVIRWNEVSGTGRMAITGVSFLNDAGEEVMAIRSGDPLTVRVLYRSDPDIEDPLLDIAVRDSNPGNWFQATNRDFGVELGRMGPRGHIDIRFGRIDANNQLLHFFFTLWDSNHREQFDWKRNLKLRVEGNPMSSGRVLLDCEWEKRISRGAVHSELLGDGVAG